MRTRKRRLRRWMNRRCAHRWLPCTPDPHMHWEDRCRFCRKRRLWPLVLVAIDGRPGRPMFSEAYR